MNKRYGEILICDQRMSIYLGDCIEEVSSVCATYCVTAVMIERVCSGFVRLLVGDVIRNLYVSKQYEMTLSNAKLEMDQFDSDISLK